MSALLNQPFAMLLLKSTLLLLAAMGLTLLMRRSAAAARHIVWASTITGVLLLPLLAISLPSWQVSYAARSAIVSPQPESSSSQSSEASAKAEITAPTVPNAASAKQASASDVDAGAAIDAPQINAVSANPVSHVNWLGWLTYLWAAGAVLSLTRFVAGLTQVARAKRAGRSFEDAMHGTVRDAQARAGVRQAVDVLRGAPGGVAVPITWGVLRPVILLPAQSADWSDDCLRTVLLHELAHIRRGDWLTHCIARLACALYWFHPLIWIAARQMREASERACDDCVLRAGVAPTEYAQRLVDVLKSLPAGVNPHTAAIAMALPRETEGRIHAILAAGINRSAPSRKRVLAAVVLAALWISPLSALRLLATEPAARKPARVVPGVSGVVTSTWGALEFTYLRDVSCLRDPNRHITLTDARDAGGEDHYTYTDRRTGKTYRDVPHSPDLPLHGLHGASKLTKAAYAKDVRDYNWLWVLRYNSPVILSEADIVKARAIMGGPTGNTPSLAITLSAGGTAKLAAFTRAHTGEVMGVRSGGKLLSAPTIMSSITDGRFEMSGCFRTIEDAQALADRLNTGTKPRTHRDLWPDSKSHA